MNSHFDACNEGQSDMNFSRRGFMVTSTAAIAARGAGIAVQAPKTKVILKLVYDHSKGMMRAVERVVRL